jgi:broad specificity phosphatase PhoE
MSAGVLPHNSSMQTLNIPADPELTELGVDASKHNGCVVSKLIKNAHNLSEYPDMKIDTVHFVGCSPLIRSMETAYYMTRKWKAPPHTIYVLPHLREINETARNKYSQSSRATMDTEPAYAMKSIQDQKAYLERLGILSFFDFHFVEADLTARSEPGDVPRFVNWFGKNVLSTMAIDGNKNNINAFIITHAGVLRDFAHEGFMNNSGFIVNVHFESAQPKMSRIQKMFHREVQFKRLWILQNFLPPNFFSNYGSKKYSNSTHNCPSGRCGNLCTLAKPGESSQLQRIHSKCE